MFGLSSSVFLAGTASASIEMGYSANWANLFDSFILGPDDPTHITPWGSTHLLNIAVLIIIYVTASINSIYELPSDHGSVLIELADTVFPKAQILSK
jgi:hypothetical protein